MNRVGTGVAGLDTILQGGFPQGSLILISGGPGSGKTVLALQMLFAHASPQSPVIYFNTLAESTDRLTAYHQAFRFFVAEKINRELFAVDLSEAIRAGQDPYLLVQIIGKVQETEASLVVIDHFRVIAEMLPSRGSVREFLVELERNLGVLRCTGLILADYSLSEAQSCPEAAIADGLVHLELTADGTSRVLRVLKMRGTDFIMGGHHFHIDSQGITVLPLLGEQPRPQPKASFWSRLRGTR